MVRKYISFSADSQINFQFTKLRAISVDGVLVVFSSSCQIVMYTVLLPTVSCLPILSLTVYVLYLHLWKSQMSYIYMSSLQTMDNIQETYALHKHFNILNKFSNLIELYNSSKYLALSSIFSTDHYFHLFNFNVIFFCAIHSINCNKSFAL